MICIIYRRIQSGVIDVSVYHKYMSVYDTGKDRERGERERFIGMN